MFNTPNRRNGNKLVQLKILPMTRHPVYLIQAHSKKLRPFPVFPCKEIYKSFSCSQESFHFLAKCHTRNKKSHFSREIHSTTEISNTIIYTVAGVREKFLMPDAHVDTTLVVPRFWGSAVVRDRDRRIELPQVGGRGEYYCTGSEEWKRSIMRDTTSWKGISD